MLAIDSFQILFRVEEDSPECQQWSPMDYQINWCRAGVIAGEFYTKPLGKYKKCTKHCLKTVTSTLVSFIRLMMIHFFAGRKEI